MGGPNIVVIGNCQARPIAAKINGLLLPDANVSTIVIHLAKETDFEAHNKLLANADFILTQPISPNYPVNHLRQKFLQDSYAAQIIVWPNSFFHGQCPSLFYVTLPNQERLIGPLAEYHLLPVLKSWASGVGVEETVTQIEDGTLRSEVKTADASLEELRDRDRLCDIKISEFISEHWQEQSLFFTFNHPREVVLDFVVIELAKFIGVKFQAQSEKASDTEPLSLIIPPSLPGDVVRNGFSFAPPQNIFGLALERTNGATTMGSRIKYSLVSLIENHYAVYDEKMPELENVRLTPSFSV